MLPITIPAREFLNEATNEIIQTDEVTLRLEHSLYSVQKWEAKWHKSFLKTLENGLTPEEFVSYVGYMNMTQNVDPAVFTLLTQENVKDIYDYMNDQACGTVIVNNRPEPFGRKEVITAEKIYSWMFAQQIPKECEKWHLNRLITQIRVCSLLNSPPKKMSKAENMARHKAAKNRARAKYRH